MYTFISKLFRHSTWNQNECFISLMQVSASSSVNVSWIMDNVNPPFWYTKPTFYNPNNSLAFSLLFAIQFHSEMSYYKSKMGCKKQFMLTFCGFVKSECVLYFMTFYFIGFTVQHTPTFCLPNTYCTQMCTIAYRFNNKWLKWQSVSTASLDLKSYLKDNLNGDEMNARTFIKFSTSISWSLKEWLAVS